MEGLTLSLALAAYEDEVPQLHYMISCVLTSDFVNLLALPDHVCSTNPLIDIYIQLVFQYFFHLQTQKK